MELTDEDWRNHEKRPQYEAAVEEMLERTDRPWAPWHVVAGDSRRASRSSRRCAARFEQELAERGYDLALPQ